MFLLPFIFLINTIVFIVLLEERFKPIVTLGIGAVIYGVSLLLNMSVDNFAPDPASTETFSNSMNVWLLFFGSIFFASNNILQKILLALIMQFNFNFVALFVPAILGEVPFAVSGFGPLLIVNLLYLLTTIITAAIFWGPLHYFYRNSSFFATIGLCIFQTFALIASEGTLEEFLNVESYPLTFFTSLILYIVVIFCYRSIYGASKRKMQDLEFATDDQIMDMRADNFNAMLVNVNSSKAMLKNLEYNLDKIYKLAENGKTNQILDVIYDFKHRQAKGLLFNDYSDNQHINALIATRTYQAANIDINVNSEVEYRRTSVDLLSLCAVLDGVYSLAIDESSKIKSDDKIVSVSLKNDSKQVKITAVFDSKLEKKGFDVFKFTSLQDVIYFLFGERRAKQSKFDSLVELTRRLQGELTHSRVGDKLKVNIMLQN